MRFLCDYGGQENRKSIKTPRTQMTQMAKEIIHLEFGEHFFLHNAWIQALMDCAGITVDIIWKNGQ